MKETYPEIVHGPLIVPWSATDARFFRAAGIPAYGFSPFWILSAEATKMKGANERIPVPSFLDGVKLSPAWSAGWSCKRDLDSEWGAIPTTISQYRSQPFPVLRRRW